VQHDRATLAADVDLPGIGEVAVEVEVAGKLERELEIADAGDPVELEDARLGIEMAVADEIPGRGALEEAVGIDAAPAAGGTIRRAARGARGSGQRCVEDLDPMTGADGALERLEGGVGRRASRVGARELEGLGRLFEGAGRGVELGAQALEGAAQGGEAGEGGVVEGELQDGVLGGRQVEGRRTPASRRR
jgi:hypothetical protein